MELQELITRGRFLFSGAPKRLDVFKLVNGRRSSKDIAKKLGRGWESVLNDIKKLRDFELVCIKTDTCGKKIRKKQSYVYQKTPIAKHIPFTYFNDIADTKIIVTPKSKIKKTRSQRTIHIPNSNQILDILKDGEDQLYEFKSPGTDIQKITKEIVAFLHTKNGGIIFYGVEDDGSVIGSDIKRQVFDQKLQNSVRNTITPQANIGLKEKLVLGSKVLIIIIPPWDRHTLYQYTKSEKSYIRKGTNRFVLKPDEIKKLTSGKYVV